MDPSTTQPLWLTTISADLCTATEPSDISFVHVSGATGAFCAALRKALPNLPGRVILQHEPGVEELEELEKVEGVEVMPHEALTEQRVHDARAYFFSNLHMLGPDTCIEILTLHLPALRNSDASRVYIAIPDLNAAGEHAAQRSEEQWRWVVDQAGLEVLSVEKGDGEGVVVARRRVQDQWRG